MEGKKLKELLDKLVEARNEIGNLLDEVPSEVWDGEPYKVAIENLDRCLEQIEFYLSDDEDGTGTEE